MEDEELRQIPDGQEDRSHTGCLFACLFYGESSGFFILLTEMKAWQPGLETRLFLTQ